VKKKIGLLILIMVTLFAIAACSSTEEIEPAPADFEFEIVEIREVETLNPNDLLAVHFIDVDDGDAILLVQGEYAMLVDSGHINMGTRVFQYLRSQGIDELEYIIATHPFEDHTGGFPEVLRRVAVKNAMIPMVYRDLPGFNAFLEALEHSAATYGAEVTVPFAGDVFHLGSAEITVLSPRITDSFGSAATPNYSIVMRVDFGNTSFLLMGDAMREVEAILLDDLSVNLSADVIKVARHGDSSATTSGLLDAVNPNIAVISAERGSRRNSPEVNNRLANVFAHVFDTGNNGNIVITSDGVNLSVVVDRDTR